MQNAKQFVGTTFSWVTMTGFSMITGWLAVAAGGDIDVTTTWVTAAIAVIVAPMSSQNKPSFWLINLAIALSGTIR
ncbi:hypothetical protein NIES2104_56930 [Leptolyngbya sp. NIES-2104]|nr:hypothetical protein NIES2104_56930 [Leptolyngbya sp. NIES-2104]